MFWFETVLCIEHGDEHCDQVYSKEDFKMHEAVQRKESALLPLYIVAFLID